MSMLPHQLSTEVLRATDAPCLGSTAMMFPEVHGKMPEARYAPAVELCDGCKDADRCADFAIANGINFGVWGATTPQDRRRIRRRAASQ